MLNDWITKTEDLPEGLMIVDEKLRPVLEKIRQLDSDDLIELEAFLNYLADGAEWDADRGGRAGSKIYDFMAGGLLKVG